MLNASLHAPVLRRATFAAPQAHRGWDTATTPTTGPSVVNRASLPDDRVPERRFALHDIADDLGDVRTRDLLYRQDRLQQPSADPSLDRVSLSLSNALLDGRAAHCLPAGHLLVPMDAACLQSPVAEAVTPDIGAIVLPPELTIDTCVLMRVAQLRSAGIRFSIDGMTGLDDSRWLLAPYADTVRLHLDQLPPEQLDPLITRADACGLEVIGCGVRSISSVQRLEQLVVTRMQGPVVAAPLELIVPALPGCDRAVLHRVHLLVAQRVSCQAVAVAAAADPALVMRLLLLHRLYAAQRHADPASCAELIQSLPPRVLVAWLEILRRSTCHGYHRPWAHGVRDQVELYRRSALRERAAGDRESIEESVWLFLRRLCSPAHYLKTLRLRA